METNRLTAALRTNMQQAGIDMDLSMHILENANAGKYDHVKPIVARGIPTIDGSTVIDRTGETSLTLPLDVATRRLELLLPGTAIWDVATVTGGDCTWTEDQLKWLGIRLLPHTAYGVLNGGSATSFADEKKNRSLSEPLFDLVREDFDRLAGLSRGRAKGVTPAYLNPDGSPGASFLELKMRSLLLAALRYRNTYGTGPSGLTPLFPMFQMTSIHTDDEVSRAYDQYRHSPLLEPLIVATGIDITRVRTGIQTLISAFSHSSEGRPVRVFDRAFDRADSPLPLPGGHGQNFAVLRGIYEELHAMGKRFVYLGNVDNLGFTPDPVSIALLAMSGKQAAFDFSFRTPVDVKGGILVHDHRDHLACADIGPAISASEVFSAEADGRKILFNCATGLFRLDYLVEHIGRIIDELPMRFSDQDKDAGRYSQAEQVTWEIIGMLDDFLVFGVDKYDRFLAAKLLLETLMTSGSRLEATDYPTDKNPVADFRGTARKLHAGLCHKLQSEYALTERDGRWVPLSPEELSR